LLNLTSLNTIRGGELQLLEHVTPLHVGTITARAKKLKRLLHILGDTCSKM